MYFLRRRHGRKPSAGTPNSSAVHDQKAQRDAVDKRHLIEEAKELGCLRYIGDLSIPAEMARARAVIAVIKDAGRLNVRENVFELLRSEGLGLDAAQTYIKGLRK